MKKFKNTMNVRGYVYDYKRLNVREDRNGKVYISGELQIATDEDAYNIVPVEFFSYAAYTDKKTGQEKPTATFELLNALLSGDKKTYMQVGTEATRVRIDGSIDVNDWVNRDGELVASNRVRGSFIHELNANEPLNGGAGFDTDVLLTSAVEREPEDGAPYMVVKGYTFNFRGDFLPITMYIRNPNGIAFMNDLDVSQKNPFLTSVSGSIVTNTTTRKKQIESAWGDVKEVVSTGKPFRTWEIDIMHTVSYQFGDEGVLTLEEVKAGLDAREQRIQEQLARRSGAAYAAAPQQTAKPAPAKVDNFDDDEDIPF